MSERHRLAGKIGAHESWARTPDRSARTAAARAAFERRFEDQVDPDRVLAPEVRAERAANARAAHFARMRLARGKRQAVARSSERSGST